MVDFLVYVEGRILGTGMSEFHRHDMEATGCQGAASGLVKTFIMTMKDWGLMSPPLLGAPKKSPRFWCGLGGRKALPPITEIDFLLPW